METDYDVLKRMFNGVGLEYISTIVEEFKTIETSPTCDECEEEDSDHGLISIFLFSLEGKFLGVNASYIDGSEDEYSKH